MAITYTVDEIDQQYNGRVIAKTSPLYNTRVGYIRDFFLSPDGTTMPFFDRRADWVLARHPNPGRIIVLGGGLGFLAEALLRRGITDVITIDNGPYVTERMATETHPSIGITVTDFTAPNPTLRGTGRIVITEDCISGFANNELPRVLVAVNSYLHPDSPKSNIIHIVTCERDHPEGGPPIRGRATLTWKPLAEWAALELGHTWLDQSLNAVS